MPTSLRKLKIWTKNCLSKNKPECLLICVVVLIIKFKLITSNQSQSEIFQRNLKNQQTYQQLKLQKENEAVHEKEMLQASCQLLKREQLNFSSLNLINFEKLFTVDELEILKNKRNFESNLVSNLLDPSNIQKIIMYWWIIDKERNFSLCMSPKSGSTMYQYYYQAVRLRELAYLISGNSQTSKSLRKQLNPVYEDSSSIVNPPKLKGPVLKKDALQFIQQNTTNRLVLVRHPLDRLYSGYRDKFNPDKPDYQSTFEPVVNLILNRYLPPDEDQIKTKYLKNAPISFHAFLNYIAATPEDKTDSHFRTIFNLCALCRIDYDYIIKVEDMKHDMRDSMEHIVGHQHNSLKEGDLEFMEKIQKEHIDVIQNIESETRLRGSDCKRIFHDRLIDVKGQE